MKTVVFTGATSFLGRNLIKGILNEGYKVYALVRKNSKFVDRLPKDENITLIYGALEDMTIIKHYVESADYFIHFAWDGSGNTGRANEAIQMQNVNYAMKALQIAYELGCKTFIFSGSQAEYGSKQNLIYESEKCLPLSAYGKAKLEFSRLAEQFCQKTAIKFVHLRIFSVYGWGDREGTLIDSCIRKFNFGGLVKLGACSQQWNYLYIRDFVDIVVGLMRKNCETGIYNIASNDTRELSEFVKDIYELSNKTGKYEFGNCVQNPEGSPNLIPNVEKLFTVLGEFEMTPFKIGISETMKEIMEEPLL